MRNLFRWLACRGESKFNETVLEEARHDAFEIRSAYRELVVEELRRWAIPDGTVAVDVIRTGSSPRNASFAAVLSMLEWEPAATLPLLLGLPFLEKKLRRAVRTHWLGDVSVFNGVWLHASEQMLASPGISDLRELMMLLTSVHSPDCVPQTPHQEQEGERKSCDEAGAALQAWHEADDRFREAQRRVHEASVALDTHGTPVPGHLLPELLRTRREANAKLREAIVSAAR